MRGKGKTNSASEEQEGKKGDVKPPLGRTKLRRLKTNPPTEGGGRREKTTEERKYERQQQEGGGEFVQSEVV